jgi:Holliday junction resolvase
MGRTSREKGKRGEREFARLLAGLGFEARRTQQFSGREGTADVASSIPGVHWEVKRYARIAAMRFLEQADRDRTDDALPVVAMREDSGPWVVMIKADDVVDLVERIVAARETSTTTSDSSSTSSADGTASRT